MTKKEIAAKVEWEGGVMETILSYGLDHSELPDDVPPMVRYAWQNIQATETDVRAIEDWLEAT